MYICVDFDGTVVDHRYPEIGEPVPGAIKWLLRLQGCGARLILFTMRSDGSNTGNLLTDAVQYLCKNGIILIRNQYKSRPEGMDLEPEGLRQCLYR